MNKLFASGKPIEANELHERLLPVIDVMFCEVNPIPIKRAIELVGLGTGIVRAPLTELEPEHTDKMIKTLKDFGVKLKEDL